MMDGDQILSDPGLAANLRGRDASLMELIDDASPEGTRNLQRLLNEVMLISQL